MITKKPKMKKYVAILVVIISIFCVGCTFTGADSEDKNLDTNLTTETEDTEIKNAAIETIIEMPEGLSEEEQEQLRVELELRQQEVERQREEMEQRIDEVRNEIEYHADLTHDGVDECIQVNIVVGSEQEDTQVKISVYNDVTLALLYETELLLHPNLGESYYLSTYNGKDYLLRYKSGINHDTASCEYEVFYLGETGEKIVFDIDEIEISLLHVEEIGVDVWKDLAEEENKYFRDAFLLASTINDRLEYSTDIERITYIEDFGWFILEDTESIERNLELFLEEVREMYDEYRE